MSNTTSSLDLTELEHSLPSDPGTEPSTVSDVAAASGELTSIPNSILKRYYGDRIRFSNDVYECSHAVSWNTKKDDIVFPIAILHFKARGEIDAMQFENDTVTYDSSRVQKLIAEGRITQTTHNCSHVGFFDHESLVLFSYEGLPGEHKKGTHLSAGYGDSFRSKLIAWLGKAIKKADIKMLNPLPGKTLENSDIEALGFCAPPGLTGANTPNPTHPSNLTETSITIGRTREPLAYTSTPDGKVITIKPSPLPPILAIDLTTPLDVCIASESALVNPLNHTLSKRNSFSSKL